MHSSYIPREPEAIMERFREIVRRGSIVGISTYLRKVAMLNMSMAEKIIAENTERILEAVENGINSYNLGDLGELIYVLSAIDLGVAEKIADYVVKNGDKIIYGRLSEHSLEDIARFIIGIWSVYQKLIGLLARCLEIVKPKINVSSLRSIGKFLLYIGLFDKDFSRSILNNIMADIDRAFMESLTKATLGDIESLIDGISVADGKSATTFINRYSKHIRGVFTKKLFDTDRESISRFIVTIAQVDPDLAKTMFEENMDNLKYVFGEQIAILKRFLDAL